MRTQKNILSQIWRMILWREWRLNRHLILNLCGLWLVVTLVLLVLVPSVTETVTLRSTVLGFSLLLLKVTARIAVW